MKYRTVLNRSALKELSNVKAFVIEEIVKMLMETNDNTLIDLVYRILKKSMEQEQGKGSAA